MSEPILDTTIENAISIVDGSISYYRGRQSFFEDLKQGLLHDNEEIRDKLIKALRKDGISLHTSSLFIKADDVYLAINKPESATRNALILLGCNLL